MTWEAAICKCARVLCTKNWFKDESMLAECSRNKRRAPTHSIFAPPPPSGHERITHWHTTPGLLRNLPKTCREEKVEKPFFFLWTVMTVKIRWTRQRVDAGCDSNLEKEDPRLEGLYGRRRHCATVAKKQSSNSAGYVREYFQLTLFVHWHIPRCDH